MILYQLRCADEHSFEAWFRDSASYDLQARSGDVECPYCGSTNVSKAPMAPHIGSSKSREVSADAPQEVDERRASEVAQQILDAVGRIREYAEQNFENVGDDFADEARKIHYGDEPERGIYGKATEQDVAELEEEGIDFVRLPGAPRRNS
ncbi:DUF1178 family protein [Magnetovibrio sp.]|uniref:DUF1178 family protein n=1 Tax=Magnetovibrio sp. TaxID=2024836 RepID=UPI002F94FB02